MNETYEELRRLPLRMSAASVNAIVVGDLTGDGRLDAVLRHGHAGTVHLTAIDHDGQELWRYDTGLPLAGGWDGSSNHVPFLCWDLLGEGRCSVAVHTAGDAWPDAAQSRYEVGMPSGERLVVLDGRSGSVRAACAWPGWKPRVMMTVAHLDGVDAPPSLVVCDETYGQEVVTVIDAPGLELRWRCPQGRPAGHSLDVGDVDGDGRQEILVGGICYNGDGSLLWRAERFGHTDMTKPAKVDPDLPGLQTWVLVEGINPGVYLLGHDGATLWKAAYRHAHFGWIGRQDPAAVGLHPHAAEDGRKEDNYAAMREPPFPIFDRTGAIWCSLTDSQRKRFMPVAWRGDGVSDFLDRKAGTVLRLERDGRETPLARLPAGLVYPRNLVRYAEGDDERESIITVDRDGQALVAVRCPQAPPPGGPVPRTHFAYRHDRSQTGSGYYLYCCHHDGWDAGMRG